LEAALDADPQVLAEIVDATTDLEAATAALVALAEAVDAAELAKTAYTDAGGEITDDVYIALEAALDADPQVLAEIVDATTDLEAATAALPAD
jgi:plasmid maintenance system antidote protein VapI